MKKRFELPPAPPVPDRRYRVCPTCGRWGVYTSDETKCRYCQAPLDADAAGDKKKPNQLVRF